MKNDDEEYAYIQRGNASDTLLPGAVFTEIRASNYTSDDSRGM